MQKSRVGQVVFFTIVLYIGVFISITALQSQFTLLFCGSTMAFVGCLGLYYKAVTVKEMLIIGLLIRLLMLPFFPTLSDDIYRFYWDGSLIWQGINPYAFLPSEIPMDVTQKIGPDIIAKMNSPDYYSVYPPVAQLIFAVSSKWSLSVSVLIMKAIIILADILSLWGLIKVLEYFQKPRALAALYFLNPLVLIEGVGNLHQEPIMSALLLWALIFIYLRKKYISGGLLLALAIGVKLLPLIFLPYLAYQSWRKKNVQFIWLGLSILIILSPLLLNVNYVNFADSIDLYFRKFEFNASIYYVLRSIGYLLTGYNMISVIGPLLAVANIAFILWLSFKIKEDSLEAFIQVAFYTLVVYLLLSTTVHPWYLIMPLLLGISINQRWVIVWTALVFLSYSHYAGGNYQEHYLFITLEYLLVALSFWWFYTRAEINNVSASGPV